MGVEHAAVQQAAEEHTGVNGARQAHPTLLDGRTGIQSATRAEGPPAMALRANGTVPAGARRAGAT